MHFIINLSLFNDYNLYYEILKQNYYRGGTETQLYAL